MALPKALSCDAQLSCSAGLDGVSAPPASLLCPTGCGTRSPRGPRGIACAQRDGVPVGSPSAQSNGDADPSLYCGRPMPRDGLSPVLGGPTPTPQPTLGPILLREAQCHPPPNPSPYGVPRETHGCPTEPTGSSQPGPPPAHPGCLKTPPTAPLTLLCRDQGQQCRQQHDGPVQPHASCAPAPGEAKAAAAGG